MKVEHQPASNKSKRVMIFTLLLLSSAAAVTSLWVARTFYKLHAEMRLTPVNVDRFLRENTALGRSDGNRIVFFGDSRIEQWEPDPDVPGAELIWRGISGETTSQMVYRFASDVLAVGPSAVVIQGGINDVVLGSALGRGKQSAESAAVRLSQLATEAANAGIDVYLLTVVRPASPPLVRRVVWDDEIYDLVDNMNDRLRMIEHARVSIVDVDQTLSAGARVLPSSMSTDTLHFSGAAYAVINKELVQAMQASTHAVQ